MSLLVLPLAATVILRYQRMYSDRMERVAHSLNADSLWRTHRLLLTSNLVHEYSSLFSAIGPVIWEHPSDRDIGGQRKFHRPSPIRVGVSAILVATNQDSWTKTKLQMWTYFIHTFHLSCSPINSCIESPECSPEFLTLRTEGTRKRPLFSPRQRERSYVAPGFGQISWYDALLLTETFML